MDIFQVRDILYKFLGYFDEATLEHLKRTAIFAKHICKGLELSIEETEEVVLAASLHDLGKISIPPMILNKVSSPTLPEWDLIRRHSAVSYSLIKNLNCCKNVRLMVLQHHERLDGSGYPAGLIADDIIFGSRIIAVADTVDSMRTRPHRAPEEASVDKIIEELEKCSGITLDKRVVNCVIKILKSTPYVGTLFTEEDDHGQQFV